MLPVSIDLISDLFPPEKRGVMIGAFSFVQLVANLLSPILGSVITKQLGWHWIFYITLVTVLIAILLVALDAPGVSLRLIDPRGRAICSDEAQIPGGLFTDTGLGNLISFDHPIPG